MVSNPRGLLTKLSLPTKDNGILAGNNSGIIDETGYHLDAMKCVGCDLEFSNTLRDGSLPDDRKFCGGCFFHVYGLQEYQKVLKDTTPFFHICWHTPIKELPKHILDQIQWVDKKLPERLGLK